LLQFDRGFDRPEIISHMQFSAWLQSRQNSHGETLPLFATF
jgi:hypothetical protein